MVRKIHILDSRLNQFSPFPDRNSLESCEEFHMLFYAHQREESVLLRAVTNHLAGFLEFCLDVKPSNSHWPTSWVGITCQALESSRFPCSVDSQKSEAFSVVNAKRYSLNSQERCPESSSISFPEVADLDHVLAWLLLLAYFIVSMVLVKYLVSVLRSCWSFLNHVGYSEFLF